MIKIENTNVVGFEDAIRGMRNPMNSWDKSDSHFVYDYNSFERHDARYIDEDIGKNDYELMMKLSKAGSVHAKFRRMIVVYVDITAPLYWWKEFDTYKVGTVANSCSKMHTLAKRDLNLSDFSIDHLYGDYNLSIFKDYITQINTMRKKYVDNPEDKDSWRIMLEMLPVSFNQKRTLSLNYEVLKNMYNARKNHKLQEWRDFCAWIETLPYSYLITSSQIW